MRAPLVIPMLLFMAVAPPAYAHPIHTTLSVVTVRFNEVTLNIRAFADDFSASVARHAGKRAPADSSASEADVLLYLRDHVTVREASGALLPLQSCGVRRAAELFWMCVTIRTPGGLRGVRLLNQMLTELHTDQVNIVQFEQSGARKTMLFTRGSAPAGLS